MNTVSVLTSQTMSVPDMVTLTIVFMAVLMLMAIASAGLFRVYHNRFSGSGEIGDIPTSLTERGGMPTSARATLEVREATREMGTFRGRKVAKEGKVERVRNPLSPREVSNVARWKMAVVFVATVGLGAAAYGFGEPPLGSEHIYVLVSLVVFFVGAVLIARGSKTFRRYHIVSETETTDASDVSPGEKVELYGKAVVTDQGTHKAPFSDDDCLVCEYEIVEKRGRNEVVESGGAGMLFYVEDDTGKVLVDPDGVELYLPLDTQVEVKSKRPPDEITRGYVDIGVNEVRTEYRERYLRPGENVYVYGDAVTSDKGETTIERRNRNSVFLITDSSEDELRKSLLSRAVAYGAVGVVLMSVGMGVVFSVSGLSVV
ncbi:MAG: GIDE domain-containing protein [Halobacteriales archaeon]|nr:GIDE domain-containing protein [Halobacteriales archaeon]